jgi:hypothetical protein
VVAPDPPGPSGLHNRDSIAPEIDPSPPEDPPIVQPQDLPPSKRANKSSANTRAKGLARPGDYPPPYILGMEEIKLRNSKADTRERIRSLEHTTLKQSTLRDYWPNLKPDSLPMRPPAHHDPCSAPIAYQA